MPATQLPLKDIHLPATISWWPPAIGWWILAILVLAVLVGAVWAYKRITRPSALKRAKKLLVVLKQDTTLDNFQKLCQLSSLMRRLAISEYSRPEIASLTGEAWLAFLDRPMQDKPFTTGVGRLLADAPFRQTPPNDTDLAALIKLCESWFSAFAKHSSKRSSKP